MFGEQVRVLHHKPNVTVTPAGRKQEIRDLAGVAGGSTVYQKCSHQKCNLLIATLILQVAKTKSF